MKEKEETDLSVQELSDKTGRTIQSIYKRIRNKNDIIQGFLRRDNEGNIIEPFRILESAVDVIYNKDTTKPKPETKPSSVEFSQEKEKQESRQEQNAYTQAIDVLHEQLNLLQDQLKAEREDKKRKDELIFQLNERLAESQRTLDQQQQLQLLDRKKIKDLEEAQEIKVLESQEQKEAKKHRGLFSLFNRNS